MPESKIRRGKALLAAALALVVFPVLSPLAMAETSLAQGPLTLDRSLELALAANPDIEVASRELAASEGTLVQGYARPNPLVSFLQEDTRAATRTLTVQIEQPIELGGQRRSRIAVAERGREIAAVELGIRRAQVAALVKTSFYQVLIGQEDVRLAEESSVLAKHAAEIASARVRAGKAAPVEEIHARVALASAGIALTQARGELAAARQRLAATWGDPSPSFELVEGNALLPPDLPNPENLRVRLEASPYLQLAELEIERRLAIESLERARRWPDLALALGLKRDEQIAGDQAVFGASIPIPLFDRNRGNRLEAGARVAKARQEKRALHNRLSAEIFAAKELLGAALDQAQSLGRDVLPGAQEAYRIASQGFELGKFDFLQVLVAQQTFFQARSLHLRALADAQSAANEIDRLLGDAAQAGPWPSSQDRSRP